MASDRHSRDDRGWRAKALPGIGRHDTAAVVADIYLAMRALDPEVEAMRAEIAELGECVKFYAKRETAYSYALKRVKILLCHAVRNGMSQQFERQKAKEAVEVIDAALAKPPSDTPTVEIS